MLKYFFLIFVLLGCSHQKINYPSKELLVKEIVKAINSDNPGLHMKTIHPKERALMTSENRDYFEAVIVKNKRKNIPPDAEISYTLDKSKVTPPFPEKIDYPVKPNAFVKIEFKTGEYSSSTIIRWLVRDKLGWHQIIGIPKPETLVLFRKQQIKKRELNKKISNHIKTMDKNLYNEIKDILEKEKSIIKAYKHHMKKTKSDRTFSVMVVKKIKEREELNREKQEKTQNGKGKTGK